MGQSQIQSFTNRSSVSAESEGSTGQTRQSDSGATSSSTISTTNVQHTLGHSTEEEFPPLPQTLASTNAVADNADGGRWGPHSGTFSSPGTVTTLSSMIASIRLPSTTSEEIARSPFPNGLPIRESSRRGFFRRSRGNSSTNRPNHMIDNQYGMSSLLICANIYSSLSEFGPSFKMAPMDTDYWPPPRELLESFSGSPGNLFGSGPQDTEHAMPPEDLVRRLVHRILLDAPLESLGNPALFWIFYNFCGKKSQLIVAKELYNRGWRYHKTMKRWLKPLPDNEATYGGDVKHGLYYCWNPLVNKAEVKKVEFRYTDLDVTPATYQLSSHTLNARVQFMLPKSQQQQQQQQRQ
ncbi:Regulator of gene activity [Taenia solium]|eukprot:TsM_001099300 transcript=TsM_001099300 gene=TsM_001099300